MMSFFSRSMQSAPARADAADLASLCVLNLFLVPRHVRALVEYWLSTFRPMPDELPPPTPPHTEYGVDALVLLSLRALLARIADANVNPTLELVANDGIGGALNANNCRWSFVLDFGLGPRPVHRSSSSSSSSDQSLCTAVPTAYLNRMGASSVLSTLAAMVSRGREFWGCARIGGVHAAVRCTDFAYARSVRALYPHGPIAIFTLISFMRALPGAYMEHETFVAWCRQVMASVPPPVAASRTRDASGRRNPRRFLVTNRVHPASKPLAKRARVLRRRLHKGDVVWRRRLCDILNSLLPHDTVLSDLARLETEISCTLAAVYETERDILMERILRNATAVTAIASAPRAPAPVAAVENNETTKKRKRRKTNSGNDTRPLV